jgi:S-adenosylmethionine:diacylglycerol 3-amino-3-carboxypropyl transferase
MVTQANRKITSEAPLDQNDPYSVPAVCPTVDDSDNGFHYSGIFTFAYRMISDRNLYGSLAFAETAESLRLNIQALQVGRRDRVVGVTSSGDLLLALLAAGPQSVIGFDANNAQTVLAHLKTAAIATLSVENYLHFMGLIEADPQTRVATFNRISRSMPSFARRDILHKQKLVEEGILNQGMTHLIIQVLRAMLARVMSTQTLRLFLGNCGTDEDRLNKLHQLMQKRAIRYLLQPLLRAAAPRLKWLFFPHRFCRISSRPDEIIADFFNTFRNLLVQGVRANPVLCRSAVGHIHPEWWQHLYNDLAFQQIRDNLSRLSLDTADILSGLKRISDGWATRVYLSNVADYLSEEQLKELVHEVQRATAPGARIVYCSMYDQDLLRTLGPQIPENELRALQNSDNVFIYPLIMVRKRDSQ